MLEILSFFSSRKDQTHLIKEAKNKTVSNVIIFHEEISHTQNSQRIKKILDH